MERARNEVLPLVVPALVAVPAVCLVVLLGLWRWHDADARAAVTRRAADCAASAERLLDAAVQRQSETTRVLATSPVTWLWVKFQGERLTLSNRAHAQRALDEMASYAGLLPGVTVFLASEHTRTVYQSGAAVAVLSAADPRVAWYPASLASEGVVVSDDPRQVRTSMRLMNGKELLGAVSCVGDVSGLAAGALSSSEDERSFSFVLADTEGTIVLSRGPQIGTASTVFDLYDPGERPRLQAAMDVVSRPGGMTVGAFTSKGRRTLTAVTRTGAPGWYLLVSSEIPGLPAGRIVAVAAVMAAGLALIVAAIFLFGMARINRLKSLVTGLNRQRDEAVEIARDREKTAARLREAAGRLRDRARALAAEAQAGAQAVAETVHEVGVAEDRGAELRAGVSGRLSVLDRLVSAVTESREALRQVHSAAEQSENRDAALEEELNRIITTGAAASVALDTALKEAGEAAERAERARMLALNSTLEASRPGSQRRMSAPAAEEMRRLAEASTEGAQALSRTLEEAREALRAVGRLAQGAGEGAHDAAARSAESASQAQATVKGIEDALARLGSANAGAAALGEGAPAADRARSAADGLARVLERITSICGEISDLSEEASAERPDREPSSAKKQQEPPAGGAGEAGKEPRV